MQFYSPVFVLLLAFAIEVSSSAFNDRVIDLVLRLARNKAAGRPKLQQLRMPGNMSFSGVFIDEVVMENMLNMYRVINDSHLELSDSGFGVRTALEIRNVTMRGRYVFDKWPLKLHGEIESLIEKVTLASDITLDRSNFRRIRINSFKCVSIENILLKKMTGAYDFVRSLISSTLNSWLGKRYLKSAIETTGAVYFQAHLS